MTPPVRPSVGRSVIQNFLKGSEVTLPCSYRSTCFKFQFTFYVHTTGGHNFLLWNNFSPKFRTNRQMTYVADNCEKLTGRILSNTAQPPTLAPPRSPLPLLFLFSCVLVVVLVNLNILTDDVKIDHTRQSSIWQSWV